MPCLFNMLFLALWKTMLTKLFSVKRNRWCWKLLIRMFLKLWQYRIIWHLFAGFKTIILCSVHSAWFVKMYFLLKYGSWKPQLESWNTNHESLNWTLKCNPGKVDLTRTLSFIRQSDFEVYYNTLNMQVESTRQE